MIQSNSNSSTYTPDFKVTFRHTGPLGWLVVFAIRRGWVKIEFDPISIKEMFQFSATAILSATDAANQANA